MNTIKGKILKMKGCSLMKTKRILAMAICAVLWLSSTMVLAGETAVPTNLLADFDPSFESGEWAEGVRVKDGTNPLATDGGHTGANSVTLATKGNFVQFAVSGLKPATNYAFSFWMKNSLENSLQIDNTKNYFTLDGETISTDTVFASSYTFGAVRTGNEIAWRQVSVNFTTPYKDANGVVLRLTSALEDEHLRIDDVSLVETGNTPNFIANGNLEALDTASAVLVPVGLKTPNGNTNFANVGDDGSLFLENDGSNHYVHFTATGAGLHKSRALVAPKALNIDASSAAKRYKVSFKFKSTTEVTPPVRFYDKNTNYINVFTKLPKGTANTWETYNLYIDATDFIDAIIDGKVSIETTPFAKDIWFGYFNNESWKEMYLDDLYAYYDENSIDFYESLTLHEADGSRFFSGGVTTAVEGTDGIDYFANALTSEKGVEVKKLSDMTEDGSGNKTVTTRAHYLPVEGEGGSFAEQSITLISAVYKYEGGVKTLESVGIETGTSTNGQVIDVVDTVQVPANTATATYKVEATVWDSVSGLKPLMEKAVLN